MSDSDALKAIKREFGMRDNVIERAFKSSESFRAVCRDYQDCARALSRWRKSASEEARLREAEYSELLLELTAEIEARLQAVGSIGDTRSDA
jgi:transposase-like protein